VKQIIKRLRVANRTQAALLATGAAGRPSSLPASADGLASGITIR
jgi:hypothetical protein